MTPRRLEAFSDGVIAIIITIMVLELRPPHGVDLAALRPLLPAATSYVLSFIYIGIYWNNHHHMLHAARRVDGTSLWANLHLLFWLSLVPFVTDWMGETRFAPVPTAAYGVVMLMAALAYELLQHLIARRDGADSILRQAIGSDWKGKLSLACYVTAIVAALRWPWAAGALYVAVAAMWLAPDRRIERAIRSAGEGSAA
jgi:uncharacterized membrane protein